MGIDTENKIIRQVAIKCAVELAKEGRIRMTEIFEKANRIVEWIHKDGS